MNPFLVALFSMLFRYAVVMLAGALGLTHVVQPIIDQYTTEFWQLSVSVGMAMSAVGYAVWRKFKDRQKLVTALASPMPMTEKQVESLVKRPDMFTPSVTTPKDAIPI